MARLSLNEMGDGWQPRFEKTSKVNCEDVLVHTVGKNTKTLVPISITKNLVPIMSLFINEKVRELAGVPLSNPYVFASTRSDDPVNGSHEIGEIRNSLDLSSTVTATSIRHYVATKFPQSHILSEGEKEIYFKHFGHHEAINSTIYQSRDNEKEKNIASMIRRVVRNDQSESSGSASKDDQHATSGSVSNDDSSSEDQALMTPLISVRTIDPSPIRSPVSDTRGKFDHTQATKRRTSKKRLFRNSDSSSECSDEDENISSIRKENSRVRTRSRIISYNGEKDMSPPKKRDRKYKRWSMTDNNRIRKDFIDVIQKEKFLKPPSDLMKKYVRENKFDYMSSSEALTPVRERHLLRKLYNEQKLYKHKVERISREFLSPNK